MARADLLITLVRSASQGNQQIFRQTLEAMIAEERAKQHHVLAHKLEDLLQHYKNSNDNGGRPMIQSNRELLEIQPQRRLEDLVLPAAVTQAIEEIVEEQNRAALLRSYNLEPRHRILLVGPPGNGKTSLAEALAEALMVPFYVVRYETVVASYLGETSTRLQRLFDFVQTRKCVLFFDEFDTLGKERGDEHETGEIKRVVSTLLLQIDRLPSHVVVVTATNHPELLDRAVWRRFQLRLELPLPSRSEIRTWLEQFQQRTELEFGMKAETLAQQLIGANFGEIEQFALDVLRRTALSLDSASPKKVLTERLRQWQQRVEPAQVA